MKISPSYPEFNNFFSEVFGQRWPALSAALREPARKAELQNPFGLQPYSLDEASLMPAKHLALEKGQSLADLCSSPGGKALASIFSVQGEGEFLCGDLSPARVQRLKAVFHDCLPPEVLARTRIARGDSSRWGLIYKDRFDRVLVDAPCSGERHLLESPKELARWSLKGSKRLAVRQHALLCAGLDCLAPGGRLVYSTCTISPIENDGVIAKLLKSRKEKFRVVKIEESMGEPTEHGWILLPDKCGCGPIYFAVLEKVPGSFSTSRSDVKKEPGT